MVVRRKAQRIGPYGAMWWYGVGTAIGLSGNWRVDTCSSGYLDRRSFIIEVTSLDDLSTSVVVHAEDKIGEKQIDKVQVWYCR